ncbi:tRNA (guanine-N(7)-)-methyltransferase [Kordiimonas sediminis]|uniref:tRNA (guanine-N(7)-)-methyltransferase n=1 Tax=Kordiimonas sediminis TaxID=1735581 RepID=A0A919E669_9PROT|nr:tRNA (guanine(46)-N(7))-methyltransferase TrmB [Kordiimonas sediminis]GHF16311.1 tRNA (guanine-N(7)-)-methyltransferase [Kordiimonas sediminis]
MSKDTPDTSSFKKPEQRFFGRRKSHALSDRKQSLMDDLLPSISVNLPEGDAAFDPVSLFPAAKKIWLEIGFGKGEHMAWQAERNPDVGFIGCEPYINGTVGLLSKIDEEGIDNIRVYADDARHVIWKLPDASVDRVFLLHPDPWRKRRHARRRFVNKHNLDDLARIIRPGGELRVGTDHAGYREWTAIQMSHRDDFVWQAERPSDWRIRPDDWCETRYEAKSLREGRPAVYFRYKRV